MDHISCIHHLSMATLGLLCVVLLGTQAPTHTFKALLSLLSHRQTEEWNSSASSRVPALQGIDTLPAERPRKRLEGGPSTQVGREGASLSDEAPPPPTALHTHTQSRNLPSELSILVLSSVHLQLLGDQ